MDLIQLGEYFAAHYDTLVGKAQSILYDRDMAEDVVQEVMVKMLQTDSEYDPGLSAPLTWLVNAVGRRALDEKRDRQRENRALKEVLYRTKDSVCHDEPAQRETELDQHLTLSMVEELLNGDSKLKDSTRYLIKRLYFDGLSLVALAQEVGLHQTTINERVERVFKRWKKVIRKRKASEGGFAPS